jgi:RNA polymerase sigma-70 factor (ECF subfamily)
MERNNTPNPREITRIVETYADMLLRLALNRTQNISEAEDIVQSVYLRLLRAHPQFRSAAHEKAWLLRTAINLCKDFKKSAAYRSNTSLDESTTAELSPETTEVLEVVKRLPEADRYAVYLFYFERMSIREIAYALNEKEGTVSARLSRHGKKRKTLLKGEKL